jgi:hypothetical protein
MSDNPLKSFELHEFDDFFVFVVKEANYMNSRNPKLIWVFGIRGTPFCRSMVIYKFGYLVKLKCNRKTVQVSQSSEGQRKSWSLAPGLYGDRLSVFQSLTL